MLPIDLSKLPSLERLARYLIDAQKLRREIALFENDKRNETEGWVHHYAVDTDIVHMYVDPRTEGSENGRRVGYGSVFFDDDEDTTTSLAAAVARFLFFDLATPNRPFFLMHGHDAETRGVFDAIARKAKDDSYLKLAKRRDMLAQLDRIQLSAVDTFEELEQQFPYVMDFLFTDRGAALEFDRFKELLAHGSVARFTFGIGNSTYYQKLFSEYPEIKTAFDVPSTLSDQADESLFRTEWDKRLNKRPWKAKADYSALSRIELLNKKLSLHKHRILLITGDTGLIEAGRNYVPDGSKTSFSQKYLRHPRAFLAAPEVIAPFEETENMQMGYSPVLLSKWLDYLLAYLDDDILSVSDKSVNLNHKKLANDVDEVGTIDDFADSIRHQWSNHVERLNKYYGASNPSAKKLLQKYSDIGDTEEFGSHLSTLLDSSIAASQDSWESLLDVLANAGFVFLETEHDQNIYVKRNAPPVLLENYTSAYSIIKRLTTTADDPLTARELIEQLRFLGSETSSGYMRALAYSILFASRDRWAICKQLVDQALSFVHHESLTSSGGLITGREAFFLKSIALRMLARSTADLESSEQALHHARNAYLSEQIAGQDWLDIRFDCERLTIRVARHLFDHFSLHGDSDDDCTDDLDGILEDYIPILSTLNDVPDKWIALNLERSICVNLLTIDSLYGGIGSQKEIIKSAYFRLLENVNRNIEGNYLPESFLVKAVRFYGASKFTAPNRKDRRNLQTKILRFQYLISDDPNSILVTPYDRARYQHLFRLTQLNLLKVWPS